MAERLAEVEARRASVEELRAVTDAMRSLAAARLQQALAVIGGTRAYAGVIGGALAQAVGLLAERPARWPAHDGRGRPATVLFAPEHGFVGAFAERLAEAALDSLPERGVLWAVGSRGAALLEERGRPPDWAIPMATHIDAVTATGRRVAEALYRAAADGTLGTVSVLYGRSAQGGAPEVARDALLPLDLAWARGNGRAVPPITNLPPAELVPRLVDEYVFARLAHAAMESFAAENAARFAVLMAARQNIDATLDALTGAVRRLRQEQITTELIELATGAEALQNGIGNTSSVRTP